MENCTLSAQRLLLGTGKDGAGEAIGYLPSLRHALHGPLGIEAASVPADDLDLRRASKPPSISASPSCLLEAHHHRHLLDR